MTKFKTNVFKYLIIPAIVILALLCFAPKANAFFTVPEDTPSFSSFDLQYMNFPSNVVSQASSKFGNILAFTCSRNDEKFVDYSELYYILSISGQSFSSVEDIADWLASCYFYAYDSDSLQLYLDLFSSSGGYTEEEYQSAIDAAVSEALAKNPVVPVSDIYSNGTVDSNFNGSSVDGSQIYVSEIDFTDYIITSAFFVGHDKAFCTIDSISAYYADIKDNVSDLSEDNIIRYLSSKNSEFESESYKFNNGFLLEAYQAYDKAVEAGTITEEDRLIAQYEQGKIDGVIEFKSSSEYTTEISEAKQQGADEYKQSNDYHSSINLAKNVGVEEYKKSDAYASVLNDEYNIGYSEGVSAGEISYKASNEYKAALSDEYDDGFDDGYVEGQQKVNVGPIIAGISLLGIVCVVILIITRKNKKQRRRR